MIAGVLVLILFLYLFYYFFFSQPNPTASSQNLVKGSSSKSAGSSSPKKVRVIELPKIEYPPYLVWVVSILVLAYQVLVFEAYFGLGYGIFTALAVIALGFVYKSSQRTLMTNSMVAMTAVVALLGPVRATGFVQSVDIAFVLTSAFLILFFRSVKDVNWQGLWLLKYGILLIPETLGHYFRLIQDSTRKEVKRFFSIGAVLKTVILTLIILFVFIQLLSQADPVFAKLIKEIWEDVLMRVLAGIIVAWSTVVAATVALRPKKDETFELKFFSVWDVFIPVASVIILFGVFLAIQYQYLFGSHQELDVLELTYSEYVRKGFIELMWASLIGSLVAYFVFMKTKVLTKARDQLMLKVVNLGLAGELILLVASAYRRNVLYVETFGLTRVRIVGNIFLAWIVGSLALLMVMVLVKQMKEKHFLMSVWWLSVVVVLFINAFNIDRYIFTSQPELETTKDYFYLANLSDDIAPEWRGLIVELDEKATELTQSSELSEEQVQQLANVKLALTTLDERWDQLHTKYAPTQEVLEERFPDDEELPDYLKNSRKWQSTIWKQRQAYETFSSDKAVYVDMVDAALVKIEAYEGNSSVELYDAEIHLMREYRRPFISTELEYAPRRGYKPLPTPPSSTTPSPAASVAPVDVE